MRLLIDDLDLRILQTVARLNKRRHRATASDIARNIGIRGATKEVIQARCLRMFAPIQLMEREDA